MSDQAASKVTVVRGNAWWALTVLAAINILNYLDRNIIFALFEPLKAELSLTDSQLGWLASAYVLVFSIAALPFGLLSDLKSRKSVVAGGVALFSAFTALGGLARNYVQLFITRAAVGAGEAAYGPAANSMIADYFPGRNRALAMGILAAGVPIGGSLGVILGGYLEGIYGWRLSLVAVGLPGFLLALLASQLADPTRHDKPSSLRRFFRSMKKRTRIIVQQFLPAIIGTILGLLAAWILGIEFGADSKADVAALSALFAIGLIWTIWRWVRLFRDDRREETPFTIEIESAFEDLSKASRVVLRTPTLIYVFLAGAMISFGMNGIVGWGPAFMSRTFGLTVLASTSTLGGWALASGTLGALFGGWLADFLGRWTDRGRVIVTASGFLLGGPLAIWLLTIRDLDLFVPMFAIVFFCFSWYNGPMAALVFDVVPSRIGATVSGVYLLFIHLAGDAIAFPLVGKLSDHIGLDRAVMVLPIVALAGGIVILGAMRTLTKDMARVKK